MTTPDKIIIGAGLYGLYAARLCVRRGESVVILECDPAPFCRATYINQARVHMGYHYPRSLSTAMKSAGYFRRFCEDFSFCIEKSFRQIYATSREFSWTNAEQFASFCRAAGIRCEELPAPAFFRKGMCDGAFLTEEYTYDALLRELETSPKAELLCGVQIDRILRQAETFSVSLSDGRQFETPYLLNATYASANQILDMVEGIEEQQKRLFEIKYELCEIILTRSGEFLRDVGLTVMDGPFFSIMPFGKTGYHSLTAVAFTPHMTCRDRFPSFPCQEGTDCTPQRLRNCDSCPNRPESAWPYMDHLARKYMKEEYCFTYERSLFSMKPILKASEVDDSRPTAIRVNSQTPRMVSVLSGKINTVYDLDEYL
ncbi:MAG: FAD-dependent oxidoreductase [Eubacteriales bacterium]|nr:FAD-dependent oxidoreductase [Eubacteriales bacterium]